MRLAPRILAMAFATLTLASCSHGTVSALPTAPTASAPAVTIRSLTITPVGGVTIIAGNAVDITSSGPLPSSGAVLGAFAQYTDGSGKYVEAKWTTSEANVLVVSGSSLKAMSRGSATLSASVEGQTATETFIVEPNMAGTWTGSYVIDQCVAGSASMEDAICAKTPGREPGLFPVGTAAPLTFQLVKNRTDLSAVTAFGELRGTLIGTDRGQNFLTLRGDLKARTTTLTIVHWDSRAKTDAMDGFIGLEVRIDGLPGWAAVTAHFDKLTRR